MAEGRERVRDRRNGRARREALIATGKQEKKKERLNQRKREEGNGERNQKKKVMSEKTRVLGEEKKG